MCRAVTAPATLGPLLRARNTDADGLALRMALGKQGVGDLHRLGTHQGRKAPHRGRWRIGSPGHSLRLGLFRSVFERDAEELQRHAQHKQGEPCPRIGGKPHEKPARDEQNRADGAPYRPISDHARSSAYNMRCCPAFPVQRSPTMDSLT